MSGGFERWQAFACLFLLVAGTSLVFAHRLDECLEATLIEIKPDEVRVQINMNPGVQVADAVIWQIDLDHDGKITRVEGDRYAKMLVKQLALALDEERLKLEFLDATFDLVPELKDGTGNIQVNMRASSRHPSMRAGDHVVSFENHHQPQLSVYLLNAVLPKTPAIRILKQERSENQSTGRIHFSFKPAAHDN